jgi:transcriptional accessory protein Tex/SPT6
LEGSTEEISVLEAISMARYERNPLVETLSLWSDNVQQNGIISMNLHPFQSFINQRKLKDALEFVAIEAVNLVGVDINEILKLKEDTCRKVLQFVCGFGPRKAFDFY